MKRLLVLGGGVLAGLAAGAIWTWVQSDRFRADARVLVRPQSARIVPAVQALAESSLVASNVAQTLHLSSPPHVSAKTGKQGVLKISTEAGDRERARQIDAEVVVILTQKVQQHFSTAGVTATLLDPAHVAEQTSPTPGPNLLITGLAGLVVGLAAAAGVGPGSRRLPEAGEPRVERRLQERIDQVAKRERALAQRAGQLAAREKDLERREQGLIPATLEVETRQAELEAAPAPQPEPEPAPVPLAAGISGRSTLQGLEALTRERTEAGASTDQQEEWSTYLFFLREHADADGTLPPSFDQLINDIFGPLPQHDA